MVTETTKVIAERIKAARNNGNAVDITDAELARRVGMARGTLQSKLGGTSDYKLPELSRVCRVLGLNIEALTHNLPKEVA